MLKGASFKTRTSKSAPGPFNEVPLGVCCGFRLGCGYRAQQRDKGHLPCGQVALLGFRGYGCYQLPAFGGSELITCTFCGIDVDPTAPAPPLLRREHPDTCIPSSKERIYLTTYIYMCIYIYISLYIRIYTHIHTHAYMHNQLHTCNTLIHPSIHASIHPSSHKYMHTGIDRYITLHYITLHYITLHYITLHYITLHCFTLHYITLHYITLHYVTLHYIT